MLKKLTLASLAALAVAATPAEPAAQQRPSARPAAARTAPAASQREMQAWYAELQQVGARLQAASARALQDPRLRAAQEGLARELKAGALRADPGLAGLESRARAMEQEFRRAQQAGDQAAAMRLAEEARRIEIRVMNAQKRVMADPAFANRARAFETELMKEMAEVEPQTPQLLQRAQLLQGRLQTALRQQSQ